MDDVDAEDMKPVTSQHIFHHHLSYWLLYTYIWGEYPWHLSILKLLPEATVASGYWNSLKHGPDQPCHRTGRLRRLLWSQETTGYGVSDSRICLGQTLTEHQRRWPWACLRSESHSKTQHPLHPELCLLPSGRRYTFLGRAKSNRSQKTRCRSTGSGINILTGTIRLLGFDISLQDQHNDSHHMSLYFCPVFIILFIIYPSTHPS